MFLNPFKTAKERVVGRYFLDTFLRNDLILTNFRLQHKPYKGGMKKPHGAHVLSSKGESKLGPLGILLLTLSSFQGWVFRM